MTPRRWLVQGYVQSVTDGDSVVLDLDLGWRVWLKGERVRVAHIDAPEINTDEGRAAATYLTSLFTPGMRVEVSSSQRDKFGRILADLTLPDGRDVAALMLAAGLAKPYEGGAR